MVLRKKFGEGKPERKKERKFSRSKYEGGKTLQRGGEKRSQNVKTE